MLDRVSNTPLHTTYICNFFSSGGVILISYLGKMLYAYKFYKRFYQGSMGNKTYIKLVKR